MSQYILDTDHVTLSQHGNPKILQRAQVVGSSNIFITTVTLEEQLKGRLSKSVRINQTILRNVKNIEIIS